MKTFTISPAEAGTKIDRILVLRLPQCSRRQIRRLLDKGEVFCGQSRRIRLASFAPERGTKITVNLAAIMQQTVTSVRTNIKLSVLYLDSNFLIINKPAHYLSDIVNKSSNSLGSLLEKAQKEGQIPVASYALCHRLDYETSGALVIACSKAAMNYMSEQFKNKKVKKTYLAICYGKRPLQRKWQQRSYLKVMDTKSGWVQEVSSGGKSATTDFICLKTSKDHNIYTLQCFPHTGRMHQIRVHLAASSLCLVGEKKYMPKQQYNLDQSCLDFLEGVKERAAQPTCLVSEQHSDENNAPEISNRTGLPAIKNATSRHLLHAQRLEFDKMDASGKITVEAKLPQDMLI